MIYILAIVVFILFLLLIAALEFYFYYLVKSEDHKSNEALKELMMAAADMKNKNKSPNEGKKHAQ